MYVVIPAYMPDEKLLEVVDELKKNGHGFVVVDDGSGEEYREIFDRLERENPDSLVLLRHEENRGKGRAMKTAFEYLFEHADPEEGLVTVDADGQHLPADVEKVIDTWKQNPDCLVLGSRHFTGNVPFRSRSGNAIMRTIFAVVTGVRVYDTQTGLRAFAVSKIPEMLSVKGERYEYEISQLLYAAKERIEIVEAPIETVYIAGNRSSHFKAFKDSLRISKMILFFMLASFVSFLLDYGTVLGSTAIMSSFKSAVHFDNGITCLPIFGRMVDVHLIALILGRIMGSTLNFLLNRNIVFRTGSKRTIIKYICVMIFLITANFLLLTLITRGANSLPLWIAQLVVQATLYPINFMLQRKVVFRTKRKTPKKAK